MADEMLATAPRARANAPDPDYDWRRIAYLVQVSRALDRLEEIVPDNFFRVNRKYLLSAETIKAISPDTYGKVRAEVIEALNLGTVLIISREKAAAFRQWFRTFATAA